MKTKRYLLLMLVCATSLLYGQSFINQKTDRTTNSNTISAHLSKGPHHPNHVQGKFINQRGTLLRSAAVEKLDSLVVEEREKVVFVYDQNGHLDEQILSTKWIVMGEWIPFVKIEYDFSPEGLLLEEIHYWWDSDLNVWALEYRDEYTYLPDGDLGEYIGYYWNDFTLAWERETRTTYTYLSDHRIDQTIDQQWNSGTQMWETNVRSTYHYDMADRLEEIIQDWYQPLDDDWLPFNREEYLFDTGDLPVEISNFSWDGLNEIWQPQSRINYSYNAKGELIIETSYYYESIDMAWIPEYQEASDYDEFGNQISTTFKTWDFSLDAFIPGNRRNFNYDTNTPIEDIQLPYTIVDLFSYNHKMLRISLYSYNNGMWEEDFFGDFYYSPVTTSIDTEFESDVQVYPNPASDLLILQIPASRTGGEVTLMHASGLTMLHQTISGEQTLIPINHIPAGMYVLHYRNDQGGVLNRTVFIHR